MEPEPASPAAELIAVAARVVGPWAERVVAATAHRAGVPLDDALHRAAVESGAHARDAVVAELGELLAQDVDAQQSNPLTVLRRAVRYPTAALRAAGVPPLPRDEFTERAFPEDVYGLAPATWADVDPELVEPGLMWGAWKAATVLQRRRREGRR